MNIILLIFYYCRRNQNPISKENKIDTEMPIKNQVTEITPKRDPENIPAEELENNDIPKSSTKTLGEFWWFYLKSEILKNKKLIITLIYLFLYYIILE